MKKILIIIFAVIVVAIGIYAFFLRGSSAPATPPDTTTGTTGSLPSAGSPQGTKINSFFGGSSASGTTAGQLSLVSDSPVETYFVNQDRSVSFVEPNGTIFSLSNNQSSTLSTTTVTDLLSADFSYDGQKVVLDFGSQSNPQAAVFDVPTKSWALLSGGVQSPKWSPSDKRLAYLRDNDNGTETLFVADFSTAKSTPTALGTFHIQDMIIAWAGPNEIFIYDRPTAHTFGSALIFDIKKKVLNLVFTGRSGIEMAWSSSTSPVGISFVSGQASRGGHLQLVDLSGNPLQNLSFITLPSKCVFGNVFTASSSLVPVTSTTTATLSIKTSTSTAVSKSATTTASSSLATTSSTPSYLALYCGVPRDQDSLNYYYLPDDYEQGTIFTSDDVYRINTTNGHIDTLWGDSSQNLDLSNLKTFNNAIFFVNRYDQKLYSISL